MRLQEPHPRLRATGTSVPGIPCSGELFPVPAWKIPCSAKFRESPASRSNCKVISRRPAPRGPKMAGDFRNSLIISLFSGKSAIEPGLDRVAGPGRAAPIRPARRHETCYHPAMLSSVVRRMIAIALVMYAVTRRILTNPTVIYVFRRILATIPVMAVVALFVFSLLYIAPGDPAAIIAGDQASPEDVARIRASLGLDRPFLIRFGEWTWQILHADLGISIFTNLPVAALI